VTNLQVYVFAAFVLAGSLGAASAQDADIDNVIAYLKQFGADGKKF